MKRSLILFMLLVGYLVALSQIAAIRPPVTEQEAFELICQKMDIENFDVYLKNDNNQDLWTNFIDVEPTKGWEHNCLLIRIPKHKTFVNETVDYYDCKELSLFPDGDFKPRSLTKNASDDFIHQSTVNNGNLNNSQLNASSRTWAIIISGGIEPRYNHARYWNDCSYIYKTLTRRYGIPKENIYPIMANGLTDELTVKYVDRFSGTETYKVQNPDLDNDGQADIKYSATIGNVKSVLDELLSKMHEDDQLLFYVIDHGGRDKASGSSYVCLWNHENLYDYVLADWLRPFAEKYITINAVLGQCYSGGFVDDLNLNGCVVSTACKDTESSWACRDKPYDEFVYHWTSAINGADVYGNPVNADYDKDGYVSMMESFNYARSADRFAAGIDVEKETPQYHSYPETFGSQLAVDYLPQGVDLYIKDNPGDVGNEPNLTSDITWDSPDIWVRNSFEDTIEEHENPIYSDTHLSAGVFVRIHNRGAKDYILQSGTGAKTKYVHLYWAKASTGLTKETWMSHEEYNHIATGGPIMERVYIPTIPAGGNTKVRFTWGLNPQLFAPTGPDNLEEHHFCLLAKVLDKSVPEEYSDPSVVFDIINNRTMAQKNLTILDSIGKQFQVFVRNTKRLNKLYSLEIRDRYDPWAYKALPLFNAAKVQLTMEQKVYDAWVRGGSQLDGIAMPTSSNPKSFLFTSTSNKIKSISFYDSEFDKVNIKIVPNSNRVPDGRTFIFDLIQKDNNGNIIGGESFKWTEPDYSTPIVIDPIFKPGTDGITLKAQIPESYTNIQWSNAAGNVIGTNKCIDIESSDANGQYLVSAINEEGCLVKGSFDFNYEFGIKSFTISPDGESLNVYFRTEVNKENDSLLLACISQPVSSPKVIEVFDKASSVSIDISNLSTGTYSLTLLHKGKPIGAIKFNRK